MNQQLKLQWYYTHEEIKAFVKVLVDNFEKNKILNENPTKRKYSYQYYSEIDFGLHDGFYTPKLQICEREHVEKNKPIYILCIKYSIHISEYVTEFYSLKKFLQDNVINVMFKRFQNHKEYIEILKKEKENNEQTANSVLYSLKNGNIHIGVNNELAEKILPFVQKVISRAMYVSVEDNTTVFYTETTEKQAIDHISKNFVNYQKKAESCSYALELLTSSVFNLQPNDVIEITARRTNANNANKTYLNVGSKHKVKRVVCIRRNQIILDVLPIDVTRNSKVPLTLKSRLYKFKKVN